jgi:hypothetical protein
MPETSGTSPLMIPSHLALASENRASCVVVGALMKRRVMLY